MGKLSRFGVSLNESLLERFDRLCEQRGYKTRSEAIRDLIRSQLVAEEWRDGEQEVAGTLTLIYDHHAGNLPQRLTSIQHDFHQHIVTTLHVHLDHDNCLETIVLKGPASCLRSFADRVIATRGVKHGTLNLATTGRDLK